MTSGTPHAPQGAIGLWIWRESGLATDCGGGNGKNLPAAQKIPELGCKACVPELSQLSLPFPAPPWIPPTPSEPAAPSSSAFTGGCGETAFLLFPSENYRAIWISKSSRAAGLIGSCSLLEEGGGSCPADAPSSVLRCCPWGCGGTASRVGLGGCLRAAGLGRKLGVFFGAEWVEGKGKEDVNLGKRSGVL